MNDLIKVRGARQHNLKNVDVDIPKNKVVVMTGVSGSGKSSLAFDTIYAEGQRRYVESLSAYARQFLGIMDKPDVDTIEGLSPAISIDQKTASHNPRSTVGTVTEVYDYLRLLYARIGRPTCPNCHIEITKLSLDEIVDRILDDVKAKVSGDKLKPHSFKLFSPVVRGKKGEFVDLFANLLAKGYRKIRVDGREVEADGDLSLIKTNKHTIEVEIDSYSLMNKDIKDPIFASNLRSRLSESVQQGLSLSDGLVILRAADSESLYSEKFSCPNCGLALPELEPRLFSFNSPLGACESCRGLGTVYKIDPDRILNPRLTINEGGILPFNKLFFQNTWYIRLLKVVSDEEGIDFNVAIKNLSDKQLTTLLHGTKKTYEVHGQNRFGKATSIYEKFDGIVGELERRFFDSDSGQSYDLHKYIKEEMCPACEGKRLKKEILAVFIDKRNIADICEESIDKLTQYFDKDLIPKLNQYELEVGRSIIREIITRLTFLNNVGLSYLTISRAARSLSGGELQRIRLASQIGTGLTGVLYVLDEPSIGLHPKDVSALLKTLNDLKDLSNSLLVVEHDRETIEAADYVVELGPHAGAEGGKVMFAGTLDEIKKSTKSLTGAYLSEKKKIVFPKRELNMGVGQLTLHKASEYNLKDINISIPLGNLVAVTGASGSGKSTLIVDTLYPALKYHIAGTYSEKMGAYQRLDGFHYINRVYLVDQSPIGRTPRSNPATYTGFFDDIRELYSTTLEAKARGYKKGRFSFNLKGGRCEKCQGAGVIKIEMQFLSDVYVTCDVCNGHRYNKDTLEVTFKGKSIYEVLEMTVDEAIDFFKNHDSIYVKLQFLQDVGLGYIQLGQAAPTFSGGEAQRIKLANELSRRDSGHTMYILDEPTTGLHFYDIEKLLTTLYKLAEKNNTVVIIEHNLDVIKNCQYIIDLGPEGGDRGGELLYQGETEKIVSVARSHTARYLKKYL